MKCPHCDDSIHEHWQGGGTLNAQDPQVDHWDFEYLTCPACLRPVVRLIRWDSNENGVVTATERPLLWPKVRTRHIPEEVTGEFRQDFEEACAVIDLSPKASAALSRRLHQHILREKAGVKKGTLAEEIDEVVASDKLPSDLASDLDAVRQVGNFAAHPTKSQTSGAVVEVEPGEADWLLDLVEELLDFYFVRPSIRQRKRDAVSGKLRDAGKDPLPGAASAGSDT